MPGTLEDSSAANQVEPAPKRPSAALSLVAQVELPTLFGRFRLYGFQERASGREHLALAAGDFDPGTRVTVRIHSECLTGEALGSLNCECRQRLQSALRQIAGRGGLLLYLRQEGRGLGLINKLRACALQEQGFDPAAANHLLGFPEDLRTYDHAVEMLRFFGVQRLLLLTDNPRKIQALLEAGFDVLRQPHPPSGDPVERRAQGRG